MGVALSGADRHARRYRDLLEREAERVFQYENPCLGHGKLGQDVTEIGAELRQLGLAFGCEARRDAHGLLEVCVASRGTLLRDITARIERQPMEPGRERGLATKLGELHTEFGESVLGGVACVLGVSEHMRGQTADAWGVAGAECSEGLGVTVLGALDENWITELGIWELTLGRQRGANSAAWAQGRLHRTSLLARRYGLA